MRMDGQPINLSPDNKLLSVSNFHKIKIRNMDSNSPFGGFNCVLEIDDKPMMGVTDLNFRLEAGPGPTLIEITMMANLDVDVSAKADVQSSDTENSRMPSEVWFGRATGLPIFHPPRLDEAHLYYGPYRRST